MLAMTFAPASAQTNVPGAVHVKWFAQAIVKVTLTPNYFTGFGAVKATFGAQPTPTHGPDAGPGVGQGSIDFGNVLSGTDYLYKYAAHLQVTTNSTTGFNLYGEGAADFVNQSGGSEPISSTVFYLNSTSGSPPDTNTGFSGALPFQRTAGTPSSTSFGLPPTIAYTGFPAPIAVSPTPTADFFYDYELKVPPSATGGNYFVWIVYTVVPQ